MDFLPASVRIGSLHFRLASRRRSALDKRFDANACYAFLEELSTRLRNVPWMVVSGLVDPLCAGCFVRPHSDIDIGVPLESLDEAAAAVVASGFVLTSRLLRTRLSARFDAEIHRRIAPRGLNEHRHLRFWRVDRAGALDERHFPPYVDLFPYVIERGELVLHTGERLSMHCPLMLPVALPNGACIPVEHPLYMQALRHLRHDGQRAH